MSGPTGAARPSRARAAALALSLGLAAAVPPMALPPVARAQSALPAPAVPIAALQHALSTLGGPGGFDAKAAALGPVVDRALDLDAILRASVGLGYGAIPPDQLARLRAVFRAFTVASYVNNFADGTDRFTVSPELRQAGDEAIVRTAIVGSDGGSTRVDYAMRQGPQGWRAVDVLLDGTISRVAVQRSDFRAVLEQGGAPALVARLSAKVAALSDGRMKP